MLHALLLSSLVSAATPADDARLATKLAQAIASEHGAGKVKIFVGEMAPGAPPAAELPKYQLLGSVTQTLDTGILGGPTTITTLYYAVPRSAKGALDAYDRQLTSAGWHESAAHKVAARVLSPNGGFAVSSPIASALTLHHLFCKSQNMMQTSAIDVPENVLEVAYGSGTSASGVCAISSMLDAAAGAEPSPPPLPTLNAPPGVTMRPAAIFDMFRPSSRATISTASPIAGVGAQFARQFAAAGWQALPSASNAVAYVQVFRRVQSGRHYEALLSITSSAKPQEYDAIVTERDLDRRGTFPF